VYQTLLPELPRLFPAARGRYLAPAFVLPPEAGWGDGSGGQLGVMHCVEVYCGVLRCAGVCCCSVLQCVEVCCTEGGMMILAATPVCCSVLR